GYFSGKIDDFHIYSRALSTTEIGYLMNGQPLPQSSATTPNLPGVPATPSNLVASGISTSAINLTWNNVAGETKYQIFRSSGDNTNYLNLTEVPAHTASY